MKVELGSFPDCEAIEHRLLESLHEILAMLLIERAGSPTNEAVPSERHVGRRPAPAELLRQPPATTALTRQGGGTSPPEVKRMRGIPRGTAFGWA